MIQWFIVAIAAASTFLACAPRRDGLLEQRRSGLSEINIKLPQESQYETYFGEKCADLKLADTILAGLADDASRCVALKNMLGWYRLKISVDQCEPGISGTEKEFKGAVSDAKIEEKVVKGCTYSVLLELGNLKEKVAYYSNALSAKGALKLPRSAPSKVDLDIVLLTTEAGVAAGFPPTETIVTGVESDVNLNTKLGKRKDQVEPSDDKKDEDKKDQDKKDQDGSSDDQSADDDTSDDQDSSDDSSDQDTSDQDESDDSQDSSDSQTDDGQN